MADLKQYEDQYFGLMSTLQVLRQRYEKEERDWDGRETIVEVLKLMQGFVEGQFWFFYHGFSEQRPSKFPKLNRHIGPNDSQVQFPPEHVLASILAQIAGDLATLQFCSEQRFLHTKEWTPAQKVVPEGLLKPEATQTLEGDAPTKQEDVFVQLDKFVTRSLWHDPSPTNASVKGKTVLTYFTDSVKVRVLPYANVALMGFPPSVLRHSDGLFTAAHEAGHVLYWYPFKQPQDEEGSDAEAEPITLTRNVREFFFPFHFDLPTDNVALSKQPPPPPWGEEIFADSYGALIGGPSYIKKAMDLALEHSTKAFFDPSLSDPHPMPLIRPLLMLKALIALNKKTEGKQIFSSIGEEVNVDGTARYLLGLWEQKLKERGIFDYRERTKNLVVWDIFKLETNLLVEDLVDRAIRALHYVFPDAPAADRLWGWADDVKDTIYKTVDDVKGASNKTVDHFDRLRRLFMAPELGRILIVPPPEGTPATPPKPQPQTPPTALPSLWLEWAVDQKEYFVRSKVANDEIAVSPDGIWAGDFDTVMQVGTRPSNTWLPVFAAGGWTTEGPWGDGTRP